MKEQLSLVFSYMFGSFLFFEAKNIPSVTGRDTFAHYHNPFYVESEHLVISETPELHSRHLHGTPPRGVG